MNPKDLIASYLIVYLEKQKINVNKRGHMKMVDCIFCKSPAPIIANTYKINCFRCQKQYDVIDMVRKLEPDKTDWEEEKIMLYLRDEFNINIRTNREEGDIDKILTFYEQNGFSCTPCPKNEKEPCIEKWMHGNIEHKNKNEWKTWIEEGLNLAIITGERSQSTWLDFDYGTILEEVKSLLGDTFNEKSRKGFHYAYQYEADLPTGEIKDLNLEIINGKHCITAYPSVVGSIRREIDPRVLSGELKIAKMSPELKALLLKHIIVPRKTHSEEIREQIEKSTYKKILINEGEGRSELFIHVGGRIRKYLSPQQTRRVLHDLDNMVCSPPLGRELDNTILKSIEKYSGFDEKELAHEIIKNMREVGQATHRDIERWIFEGNLGKEDKKRLDKTLAHLIQEGYILRKNARLYQILRKVEWATGLVGGEERVPFKVPYFYDVGIFNWGDMLLIGGKSKIGKCVTDGYLLTNQGLIDIEEIGMKRKAGISKLNGHMRIFDGSGKSKIYKKPNYFYKEKTSKTIKIETRFGYELEGTPEHPILIRNKNSKKMFRKLEDIQIGDRAVIVAPNKFPKKSIKPLKKLKYHIKKCATSYVNLKFSEEMTPDMARLFGYIIGDGSLQRNRVSIYMHTKEKNIVKDIKNLYINITSKTPVISIHENKTSIFFDSYKFAKFVRVRLFGIRNDKLPNLLSINRTIPKIIRCGSKEIQRNFIAALFSCESYLSKENILSIAMAPEKLIKTLHIMLLNFGIVSRRYKKWNKKYKKYYFVISIPVEFTSKFLKIFKPEKYKDCCVHNRKRAHYLRRFGNNQYQKDVYFLDKVVDKKENTEEVDVYDFNIENKKYKLNNQFWCNGFVNHNSHIAMNIVKELVEQHVKVYYIPLETGCRFKSIARQMGMKEGDFSYPKRFVGDPTKIELEPNAVTIIDWLLIEKKAETDTVFKHLIEQLAKSNGFLFVFQQLKSVWHKDPERVPPHKKADWYAKDMALAFPALATRYLYLKDDDGTYGAFHIDSVREPIEGGKIFQLPCQYYRESKLLIRKDVQQIQEKEQSQEEMI